LKIPWVFSPSKSRLTVDKNDINKCEEVTITAVPIKVKGNNEEEMKDVRVRFYDNEVLIGEDTYDKRSYKLTTKLRTSEDHEISAEVGNYKWYGWVSQGEIDDKPIVIVRDFDSSESTLEVSDNPITLGDSVTATATPKDYKGDKLGSGYDVEIKGQGINGVVEDEGDGTYTAIFTPTEVGPYTISARIKTKDCDSSSCNDRCNDELTWKDFEDEDVEVEEVLEPVNFWITVDDFHDVYFNGEKLSNPDDDWTTVDEHYVTVKNRNLIAVKGWDQGEVSATNGGTINYQGPGTATISGFIAALDKGDDEFETTDSSWYYTLTKPQGNNWRNKKNYFPPENEVWLPVYNISNDGNPAQGWENNDILGQMPVGNPDWIWSPDYYEDDDFANRSDYEDDDKEFDSPVWFRNIGVKEFELFEVTFDLNDEESGEATNPPIPNPQDVQKGTKAIEPEQIPIWAGHEFLYWESDESEESGFNFNKKIYSDITLKAIWKDNSKVTVYFNPDNGDVEWDRSVLAGQTVYKPTPDRTKYGYEFKCWEEVFIDEEQFLDGEVSEERTETTSDCYEFGEVWEDVHLIAIWDPLEQYSVKFDPNGGLEDPDDQLIYDGYTVLKPDDPAKSLYTFLYWTEVDCETGVVLNEEEDGTPIEFNLNTPIKHATCLLAVYNKDSSGTSSKRSKKKTEVVILEEEIPLGSGITYIIGDENGNARADDPTIRAELATMYARLLSLNYQATTIPRYKDVYLPMWHASYVNILKVTGILVGKADKLNPENEMFDPEGLITRADLASSIARYYEFVGETFEPTPNDLIDIRGHEAQSDIEIIVAKGMMGAYTDSEGNYDETLFLPDRISTRFETIKILNKLFGIQPKIPEKPTFNDMTIKSVGFEDIEGAAENAMTPNK